VDSHPGGRSPRADSLASHLKYKVMGLCHRSPTAGLPGLFSPAGPSLVLTISSSKLPILILVFVIFGGMGSIAGAVIGAAFIQWLPSTADPSSGYQFQDEFIYLGARLSCFMIFRPQAWSPHGRRRRSSC